MISPDVFTLNEIDDINLYDDSLERGAGTARFNDSGPAPEIFLYKLLVSNEIVLTRTTIRIKQQSLLIIPYRAKLLCTP